MCARYYSYRNLSMMIVSSKFNAKLLVFVTGFCFGALIAYIFVHHGSNKRVEIDSLILQKQFKVRTLNLEQLYNSWFRKQNVGKRNFLHQCGANKISTKNVTLESQFLFNKVKVACIILYQNNSEIHQIFNTWVKTCNHYYFVGSANEVSGYVNSIVEAHNGSNWKQFFNFVKKLDKNSLKLEDSMWFFFAVDSNLLVILENLRYLLAGLNYQEPHYLGRTVFEGEIVFNVAEAGFVLSRAAVYKLKEIFKRKSMTYVSNKVDLNIGKIFMDHHIAPHNTHDDKGCTKFHSENLEELFEKIQSQETEVVPCVSNSAVSFSVSDNLASVYTYFYVLHRTRLVNRNDFSCDILPPPALTKHDYHKWLYENQEFFGISPENMSTKQFHDLWWKQVELKDLIF